MELEKAEEIQDNLIDIVERHGIETYSTDDDNWFRLGRGGQSSGYPAIGITIGENGYKPAIRIQRKTKLDDNLLNKLKENAGNDIDFQIINPVFTLQGYKNYHCRPLKLGTSISHFKVPCGTLGCLVQRINAEEDDYSNLFILSNNHVIANNNDAKKGDIIIQPGRKDGGNKQKNAIAKLEEWIPLTTRRNTSDAAIAKLTIDMDLECINKIEDQNYISGIYPSRILPSLNVKKNGRTTGITYGEVKAFIKQELEVKCAKFSIKRGFINVIEIESRNPDIPFSRKGDSGSLIVDEDNRAVALVFAGNDTKTFAIPITEIFEKLKLKLPNVKAYIKNK
jgi:hypothetical protein